MLRASDPEPTPESSPASVLRVQLFGDFRLVYGDHPVTSIEAPRLQALLTYLLLHRDAPQSRQRLAFLLYPDSSEAQARTNLRNLVHYLRKALPAPDRFLLADARMLQWRSDSQFTLDVEEFERAVSQASSSASLRKAVNQYAGELLPGCYDDWILPERERLRQKYVETLERLILLMENQRDYRRAISYAERLLREDPLREETYRHLMRMYALSGDDAGARSVYQTCVAILRRELDAEPSTETRAEFQRINKKDAISENKSLPEAPHLKAVRVTPNNLPIQLTSFVGREQQIADLRRLLSLQSVTGRTRLLTVTGAGGSGKTRLAIQVANELLTGFQDGVWFVDLAPLSDSTLIPQAVATALSVHEQPGRPLLDTLLDYLRERELLLLMDSCEQFVAACAEFIQTLLQRCSQLQILVTSRERFNLTGETVWLVPVLSIPVAENADWIEATRSEAVRLFVERAASTLPTFELTKQNASDVAQICRRLDGIPLAIELAAARVKVLTPAQIAAWLDDAFHLLTRGSRTAPPRQQTLRAAMDWSYELLTPEEQRFFWRLSVFAGGFTLESAEQVCADAGSDVVALEEILDLVSNLLDKSLLVVAAWEDGEQARYRLLEPIRQYATEKLADSGEAVRVSLRHLDYFTLLAEKAESQLYTFDQKLWLGRLESEHGNIREALKWSTELQGVSELGLRLAGSLWHFWQVRGYLTEGRRWLEMLLVNLNSSTSPRAKALSGLGTFLWLQGDFEGATSYHEEALALYRQIDDNHGIAFSLNNLGVQAGNRGDIDRAEAFLQECLLVAREHQDKRIMAYALNNLGYVAQSRSNLEQAARLFEESLLLYQQVGAKFDSCQALDSLARIAQLRGEFDAAVALYKQSMVLAYELESKSFVAERLDGLAEVAMARLKVSQAVQLFGAAAALREAIGATVSLVDQTEIEHNLAALHKQLGEVEFSAAWSAGKGMTLRQAVEYGLEEATT